MINLLFLIEIPHFPGLIEYGCFRHVKNIRSALIMQCEGQSLDTRPQRDWTANGYLLPVVFTCSLCTETVKYQNYAPKTQTVSPYPLQRLRACLWSYGSWWLQALLHLN